MSNVICSSTKRNRSEFFDIRVLFRGCQTLKIRLQIHQLMSNMPKQIEDCLWEILKQNTKNMFFVFEIPKYPKIFPKLKNSKKHAHGKSHGYVYFWALL